MSGAPKPLLMPAELENGGTFLAFWNRPELIKESLNLAKIYCVMHFANKTLRQVAALPFLPMLQGFDVLLITSRKGNRWLLPKGWTRARQAQADTAAQEAFEESGVVGEVHGVPVGEFVYRKSMRQGYRVDCHVFVYPLLVTEHHNEWPEREWRERRWVDLAKAGELVGDPGLANLLVDLAENDSAGLRTLVKDMGPGVSSVHQVARGM